VTAIDAARKSSDVTDAIDDVVASVKDNVHDERELIGELERIRSEHLAGAPLSETLGQLQRPRVFSLFEGIMGRLTRTSVRLRRTLVRALVGEGENVSAVARRFGVSHQRISTVLKESTAEPGPAHASAALDGTTGTERVLDYPERGLE